MYRICHLNPLSPKGMQLWSDRYQMTEKLEDAQALMVRSTSVHELPLPQGLLAIARAGAGVNNIPLERCAQQGIVIFNTPGANADSVMELALCGMLLGCRDIVGGIRWVRSLGGDVARQVEREKSRFAGKELRQKTLGVIGLGAVGGQLANTARCLGMQVYGFDPYISIDGAWHLDRRILPAASREELYAHADVISLHTPLTEDTQHMIDGAAIEKMRPGVIIVNMARDALVDDEAMARALGAGKVGCYVTDFPNERTAAMPGCIPIPHLGASTAESEENCAKMAVRQVMDYLENGNIVNSVNFPDCHMGQRHGVERLTILHQNIPNSLGRFTVAVAGENINIAGLMNKSRGEYAVTILDLDQSISAKAVEALNKMEGTLRVRVIKGE